MRHRASSPSLDRESETHPIGRVSRNQSATGTVRHDVSPSVGSASDVSIRGLHFGPDHLVAAAWADLGQVRKLIMIEMIAGLRMTLNSAAKMKLTSGNSILAAPVPRRPCRADGARLLYEWLRANPWS